MLLPALRLSCFGDSGRYAFEMTIRKVTRLYADALWEDDFVSKTACYTRLIHVTTQSSAPEAGVRVEADAVDSRARGTATGTENVHARSAPIGSLALSGAVTANSGPQMELISFA
ncbi:hypothetical protein EVAR_50476_1 [Eumeta japonica]|uniref:Uncharacterized protein n=1 Tax=Eumeta variegata TaxID=151549 RepID=A0A4C1XRZ0_EUMVA|nr:hypothetical protein EVAR_50476_1 [Eumeta japonica]